MVQCSQPLHCLLNYNGGENTKQKKLHCSVCSRIMFCSAIYKDVQMPRELGMNVIQQNQNSVILYT